MKFLLILWFYLLASLALPARDLAAYRVGDVADADIITPVALDVEDTAATAALRSARAQQYPAIFRSLTPDTNDLTQAFLAAFARGRTDFLADMAADFPAATLERGQPITLFVFSHIISTGVVASDDLNHPCNRTCAPINGR